MSSSDLHVSRLRSADSVLEKLEKLQTAWVSHAYHQRGLRRVVHLQEQKQYGIEDDKQ
jgi:hypothetical protein